MRRKDREIVDPIEVRGIVSRCNVLHLGLVDGQMPYIVPMNFGAVWDGDSLTVYTHSAISGRKVDLILRQPAVFVQMDCDGEMIAGNAACEYGYRYGSFMGSGRAEIISDSDEACAGMAVLMRHQTGQDFAILPRDIEQVAVIRITLTEWTAKACR